MILETHYSIKALPIIKGFVQEVATFHGATEKEKFDIALAAEEAAMHIIENFPNGQDEIFEIRSELQENSLIIIFANKGIPVNLNEIPHYDNSNPKDSIDGLKFFLMQKLTDRFSFKNLGNQGWQTILEKKLSQIDRPIPEDNDTEILVDDNVTLGLATPEDAYKITKLAYSTYAYSYTKSLFYYPDLLAEALQNQTVISHIAKNSEGEIIAHIALIKDHDNPQSAESCSLMSDTRYRKSRYALQLAQMQFDDLVANRFNITMFYANVVTIHPITQRLIRAYKLRPFAYKLSVHEASDIKNINTQHVQQRSTNIYEVYIFAKPETPMPLNIPQRHHELANELFSEISFPVTLTEQFTTTPEDICEVEIIKNNKDKCTTLNFSTLGKDLDSKLKRLIYELTSEGMKTITIQISMNKPLMQDFEKILYQHGFFFSGLIPNHIDRWNILYTHLANQQFSFDPIVAATPIAKRLLSYVRKEFESIF